MPISTSQFVEIKQTARKGRGVFARSFIAAGTEIERVPVIVIPEDEVLNESSTVMQQYVFEWGRGTVALALGCGSMYNHSYSPNARYDDVGRMTKVFTALRDILPGEEVTINYNGDENDRTPVGFELMDEQEIPRRNGKAAKDTAAASA
ncbi:MAG: SET domain-containing protein [Fuerstiella sp.]